MGTSGSSSGPAGGTPLIPRGGSIAHAEPRRAGRTAPQSRAIKHPAAGRPADASDPSSLSLRSPAAAWALPSASPGPPPTSSRLGRTADRGGVSRPRRLRLSGGRHRRRGIARDAFIKTIADLADLGISDLGTLTPGQMHAVFEIYATHAIEAPITNDVGTKSIILPADVRAVASVRGAAPRFHPPKRQRCRRGRGCRRTPPA
jgi:hypothetical protein